MYRDAVLVGESKKRFKPRNPIHGNLLTALVVTNQVIFDVTAQRQMVQRDHAKLRLLERNLSLRAGAFAASKNSSLTGSCLVKSGASSHMTSQGTMTIKSLWFPRRLAWVMDTLYIHLE